MKHETSFTTPSEVSTWRSPSEARDQLNQVIEAFVGGAATGTSAPEAALALKVSAGLGKTSTTLRVIARHGKALLDRGHVLVYVPTLELAERAHHDFTKISPHLPSRVIRGRSASRPGPDHIGKPMCEKFELARKISGFVPSVTQALCRGTDPEGNFIQADCASGCPYLAQKDTCGPHVVFLSHAYLSVDPPIDRDIAVALRVIDEKVWPELTRTTTVSIEDFMCAPPASFPGHLRDSAAQVKAMVVDGLQRQLPLLDHVRRSGIRPKMIEEIAMAEAKSRNGLDIAPWHSAPAVAFRVDTFDARSFIASRQRERILSRLTESKDVSCRGLRLIGAQSGQSSRSVIELSDVQALERDAPLLLLDADADPEITARIAPNAEFISIQSAPVADIVQISDLTLSNAWLLDPQRGKERRASVLRILAREVDSAGSAGLLVVATKSVLRALHSDVGTAFLDQDDEELRRPLLGAVPRWFGPRMQGVNDFENFGSIVIIGRLQPGIADIERAAHAVFANDDQLIEPHVSGALPSVDTHAVMADGSLRRCEVRSHPDRRVQSILAQSRECGTLQAIARLRLVVPNRQKRVLILSNLPLPNLPVSRFTSFAALERGLEDEPDWPGFERMERALRTIRDRPVCATRLSATGLAEDLPRDFLTEGSARRFRRGRSTEELISLCRRIATANRWPISVVSLTRDGGGKPIPAIVLDGPHTARELAQEFWPGLSVDEADSPEKISVPRE
ncbi:hypothetical protein [Pseudooceanicola nitratireducens]|uniref:hypothetical protein n=1 Tax=Pseudooceanicola nitratireducens TaxID=517719 RepID=UPI003C7E708A